MFARLVGNGSKNGKAQEEDGSSENGKLDTGELEKPELLFSSIGDGDERDSSVFGQTKEQFASTS